ncbi:MAG: hypothetical protein HQK53_06575 [Oligoflexia bacterium]|nr:hypothetical protein [Oligoflexia bacterium]
MKTIIYLGLILSFYDLSVSTPLRANSTPPTVTIPESLKCNQERPDGQKGYQKGIDLESKTFFELWEKYGKDCGKLDNFLEIMDARIFVEFLSGARTNYLRCRNLAMLETRSSNIDNLIIQCEQQNADSRATPPITDITVNVLNTKKI